MARIVSCCTKFPTMKYKTIQYTIRWYASCCIKLPYNICNNSQAAIHPSCSFSPKQHVAKKIVNSKTESPENTMQEKILFSMF